MFLTAVNQLGKSLFNKELTQANFGRPGRRSGRCRWWST